jgi:hypothetical protein
VTSIKQQLFEDYRDLTDMLAKDSTPSSPIRTLAVATHQRMKAVMRGNAINRISLEAEATEVLEAALELVNGRDL